MPGEVEGEPQANTKPSRTTNRHQTSQPERRQANRPTACPP